MPPTTNNSLVLPAGLQRLLEKRDKKTGRRVPSAHCERQSAALLRPSRLASSDRLTVLYPGQSVNIELAALGRTLCLGQWLCEVRCNNELLAPVGAWREVCWFSDKDVDYLELEINMAGGLILQRHFVFARKDRFLLLADAVFGRQTANLDYRGRLPLGRGVQVRAAAKSWEHWLVCGGSRAATVLPLALPEWRSVAQCEELSVQRGPRGAAEAIHLRQFAPARRLFAPLWFDLDPRRASQPLTWRPLTVAESRQAQPADAAVGFRVVIGKRQWLVYRSLAAAANRTVLGHNLSTETLVARFRKDGRVEPLVEVE